ncbi:MAG: DUF11 domain-containing protein, partial [Promicromonosporaceae bacterium]|nr:DUF11 domain-containing protein [Promicromonosporaceae bacterium]
MEVTSPTGQVIRTVLNRGVTQGQQATGAMAARNGTADPLQRMQLRSATAGVWRARVLLESNTGGLDISTGSQGRGWIPSRWDIAVRTPAGTMQRGRVWGNIIRQSGYGDARMPNTTGGSARLSLRERQRHWVLTSEGYRFEVTQPSINGIHSAMRANGLGVHINCVPAFRSMLAHHDDPRQNPGGRRYQVDGMTGCRAPAGRFFWEPPDLSMPRTARFFDGRSTNWVNPQFSNPSITVRYEHTATGANYGGRIVVTNNQAGPITVTIAGQNRTFTIAQARAGTHNITWDGRNGAGALVPLTTAITINASVAAGRTHFVHQDVEYREGGIQIRALNGPNSGNQRINWGIPHHPNHCWDNGTQMRCGGLMPTQSGTNVNSASGAHRWGRTDMAVRIFRVDGRTTWGDGRQMNEWMYGQTVNASTTLTPRGSCTMTGAPRIIPAGQTVTHSVVVRNDGPVARPMTATVNLTNALQNGRTTVASGPTANRGTATRSGNTITWNGTLNAGQTATITYQLRAANPAQTATFTTTATVPAPNGGTCNVTNETMAPPPNPTCTKSVNARLIQPGATTTHTLTVTNTGTQQRTLSSVTSIAQHLQDGRFTFVDVNASVGNASRSGNNINWSGTLAPGARVTITYRLRAANPSTGVATATATTTLTPGGNTCTGVNETTAPPIPPPPPPTCTQTATPRLVQPGAETTHTVTIRNDGNQQRALTSSTSIANHLVGGRFTLVAGSISANRGTPTLSGDNINWSGTLTAGQTATITFRLRAANPSIGAGTVTSTTTMGTGNNNCSAPNETTAPVPPAPTCTMTGNPRVVAAGAETLHTLVITNTGNQQRALSSSTSIANALQNGRFALVAGSISASVGIATLSGNNINWNGTLGAGATVTITYRLRAANPSIGAGTVTTTTTLTPNNGTCNVVNETLAPPPPPPPPPPPTCTKTGTPRLVQPGDVTTHTVTVRNDGTQQRTLSASVNISQALAAGRMTLVDASVGSSTGSVTRSGNLLNWTGTLAGGATATITYQLQAADPSTGAVVFNSVTTVAGGGSCTVENELTQPHLGDSYCLITSNRMVVRPGETFVVTGQFYQGETSGGVGTAATITWQAPLELVNPPAPSGTIWGSAVPVTYAPDRMLQIRYIFPGAFGEMTFTLRVPADTTTFGLFRVWAPFGATWNGSCPVYVYVPSPPPPVCTKTASPVLVGAGNETVHTITITNRAEQARDLASSTSVVNALQGGRFTLVAGSAVASSGTIAQGLTSIGWHGTVPAGGTVTITYRLRAADPSIGAGEGASTTTLTPGAGTCEVVNTTEAPPPPPPPPPPPTCVKTASPTLVLPNGVTTHTITIWNEGHLARALTSQTSIANHLAGGRFTFVTGSITTSVGNASLSGTNINWSGTVPAGGQVVITYQLRAADPSIGAAEVNSTTTLSNGDRTCVVANTTTEIPPPPPPPVDPICTQVASPTTVEAGLETIHTISITNPDVESRVITSVTSLANALAGGRFSLVAGSITPSTGTANLTGNNINWSGTLPAGGTAVIEFRLRAADPSIGAGDVTTTTTLTPGGNTCAAPNATLAVPPPPPPPPPPSCVMVASPIRVSPGIETTHSVTIWNEGHEERTISAVIDITNALHNDWFSFVSGSALATVGTVTPPAVPGGTTLTWTGTLAPGQTALITYRLQADGEPDGEAAMGYTAIATLSPGGDTCSVLNQTDGAPPPPPPARLACETVVVPGGLISQGGESIHVFTLRNTGETPATVAALWSLSQAAHGAGRAFAIADPPGLVYSTGSLANRGFNSVTNTESARWENVVIASGASVTFEYVVEHTSPSGQLIASLTPISGGDWELDDCRIVQETIAEACEDDCLYVEKGSSFGDSFTRPAAGMYTDIPVSFSFRNDSHRPMTNITWRDVTTAGPDVIWSSCVSGGNVVPHNPTPTANGFQGTFPGLVLAPGQRVTCEGTLSMGHDDPHHANEVTVRTPDFYGTGDWETTVIPPLRPEVSVQKTSPHGNPALFTRPQYTAATPVLVTFTFQNTGTEAMTNITWSDETVAGPDVTWLRCHGATLITLHRPEGGNGSSGNFDNLVLPPGGVVTCEGTIAMGAANFHHNVMTIEGEGVDSGYEVDDEAEWKLEIGQGQDPCVDDCDPSISVVKSSSMGNPVNLTRPANTPLTTPIPVTVVITNDGNEALENITWVDNTVTGPHVVWHACFGAPGYEIVPVNASRRPGLSARASFPSLVLPPGAAITCHGTVVMGTALLHENVLLVEGFGVTTGEEVYDVDDFDIIVIPDCVENCLYVVKGSQYANTFTRPAPGGTTEIPVYFSFSNAGRYPLADITWRDVTIDGPDVIWDSCSTRGNADVDFTDTPTVDGFQGTFPGLVLAPAQTVTCIGTLTMRYMDLIHTDEITISTPQ